MRDPGPAPGTHRDNDDIGISPITPISELIDDFLLRPFTNDQTADLLEVVEDRSAKSTIVTSQLPVNLWHEGLGDETVADATLDRLLERSHRFELVGESRRQRATSSSSRNVKRSK
jgi:DNA replication protein DnaC